MNIDYKRKVSQYSDLDFQQQNIYQGHPYKPQRNYLTDELVKAQGMFDDMQLVMDGKQWSKQAHRQYREDLFTLITQQHSDDYINSLNDQDYRMRKFSEQCHEYNTCEDCPDFPMKQSLIESQAQGSLLATATVLSGECEIGINYSGGLHHAKSRQSSGFCWINDCVLSIIELLKEHQRVLQVDIDCHHGDGVEEAFYSNPRVMTFSLHKQGNFFPGSGSLHDIGSEAGLGQAVNFPLQAGIDDIHQLHYFTRIIDRIFEKFNPDAVLFQSGTDSLSGDKLGVLNLSVAGHGALLEQVIRKGKPMVVIGGGGYVISNVTRAWCNETSICLGKTLENKIPFSKTYYDYLAPTYNLQISAIDSFNQNEQKTLDKQLETLYSNLNQVNPEGKDLSSFTINQQDFKPKKITIDRKLMKDQEEDGQDYSDMNDVQENEFDYFGYHNKNYFLDLVGFKSMDEFLN